MAKKRILSLCIMMASLITTGIAADFIPKVAQAQGINNQPFGFGGGGISVGGVGLGGGGGSVGMSTAYRQAILNQELRNSMPSNLLRDRSGALVTVERGPSGQAFVSAPVQPYLVQSFRPSGLGYGTVSSSHAFSRWVGMIDPVGLPIHAGVTPIDSRAPSIDAWINQLASLGPVD